MIQNSNTGRIVGGIEYGEMILVPRKPTEEMLKDGWYGAHEEDAEATWRLMIEAWEASQK